MEDGVKEDKTQQKAAKFDGKAGWIKKSYGKFLDTYKDRYIQLEKTQLLVYENDEEKTCIETVDLESYDKCHELRSAFKKKNRLILIRAAKPVNKVHDIKFQAPNPEEKEAWIKALCDGINRAKNKVFDQVKVEGCSLEHVTRTRPKMQQSRRPPTRIHMKELATSSSDGILRLDLDIVDNTPNGNPPVPNDRAALSTETADEDSAPPPKKVFKPPVPPSKENKPNPEETKEESEDVETVKLPVPPTKPDSTSKDTVSEHSSPPSPPEKVLKPPMPPSKLKKPSPPATDEEIEDAPAHSSLPEDASESPTPPTKPSSTSEDKPLPSPPSKNLKPVMLSKENKPSPQAGGTEDSAEVPVVAQDGTSEPLSKEIQPIKENPEDVPVAKVGTVEETVQPATPPPKPKDPSPETVKNNSAPPDPPKKKQKPLMPPKVNASVPPETNMVSVDTTPAKEVMKPLASKENITSPPVAKEKIEDTPVSEEVLNPPEPIVDVLLAPKPEGSSVTPSPVDPVPPPKIVFEDEEGQLKDGAQTSNSEGESDNGDIRASTTALHGSRENLDEESSEDPADTPENTEQSLKEGMSHKDDPAASTEELKHEIIQGVNRTSLDVHHRQLETRKQQLGTRPPVPLKYVSKVKCASLGDLLSESKVKVQNEPLQEPDLGSEINDLNELQNNIAWELEKTEARLQESLAADGSKGMLAGKSPQKGESPEEILNKALEKLRQANEVLQEVKNIKENRTEKNKRRKSC
ncbi:pleckstrin homology domain-containing family O member 2-like [Polyodon spathula]|uniref:pleckstrin homology domain-containing family O member 2-like n=1 Tax=Polyodon spathula TaxID=7913 RepID=UPI001B7DE40C|nr:pleckstrin homology domain-containing family O member 2-like [Polyodon spathula]